MKQSGKFILKLVTGNVLQISFKSDRTLLIHIIIQPIFQIAAHILGAAEAYHFEMNICMNFFLFKLVCDFIDSLHNILYLRRRNKGNVQPVCS